LFFTFFIVSQSSSAKYAYKLDSKTISLYNLDEKLISLDDYKGKYSVLAFTFMSCPSICPMTNTELSRLEEKYGDIINILTINVDPKNDTIEKLKKYMDDNNYNWDVIVGDMREVEKIIGGILFYPEPKKYTEMPGLHPPGLHLMNEDFGYTGKNFFPIEKDVDELIIELDKMLGS
tara:strand:+ start:199 stop:726 length:528 start_codon:yes stop_codon:yes gene_type:complete